MSNTNPKIEILAPCGSYDILVAAIHAGADACYIGGNCFGARAYAENFDQETIKKAVQYAHLHGVKVYLTVNTLVKQNEIPQLYESIKPFYEVGGDALIIQDLGVFLYVRKQFPDIAIHCSTQMNITSRFGAALMKKQGADRVVTAREMSLDEIRDIKEHVDIEIETFVHGAMCYSYSGQCLMSSLAGGRSGNRGRCAQPCRKCYDENYWLSMKDMCTLQSIPNLIDAGIDSFKIEGRMKNAYYVASAVHAYRTLADDYINGCFDRQKAERLAFELANIYNRGGFSDGYFYRHNGPEMISKSRPNNQGVCIGNLKQTGAGTVSIQLSNPVYKQDVLELTTKNGDTIEITSTKEEQENHILTLNCPKTKQLKVNQPVYRTKCPVILQHVEDDYINHAHKIPVSMHLSAKVGEHLTVSASMQIAGDLYETKMEGMVAEKSNNHALSYEEVKKPFSQLGNTDFILQNFTCDIDDNVFLPISVLKKLRRSTLENLEETFHAKKRRTAPVKFDLHKWFPNHDLCEHLPTSNNARIILGVSDEKQLQTVLTSMKTYPVCVYGITVPFTLYDTCKKLVGNSIHLYAELPHVIHANQQYLQDSEISGIYIRNIDGLAMITGMDLPKDCEIICDASLYCYNRLAHLFIKNLLHYPVTFVTPRELSLREINDLQDEMLCLSLYEYQPVMISANCIQKNKFGCKKEDSVITIRDEMGNRFIAKTNCRECYNVIYNKLPYSILDKYKESAFTNLHKNGYIIRFTIEDDSGIMRVMQGLSEASLKKFEKTSGHLYRGVM